MKTFIHIFLFNVVETRDQSVVPHVFSKVGVRIKKSKVDVARQLNLTRFSVQRT